MLAVVPAVAVAANTPFSITVPGQYRWKLLAVRATLARAVGGTPNRFLQLSITDGTNTIVTSPAEDAGTEPGTLTATWCNASPLATSSGSVGVTVGPIGPLTLPAGYRIVGTVISGAVTDQWSSAVAWVDETFTGGR